MDARAILLSDDKTQVLTQGAGGFAERCAALLQPLCNIRVYDADGNPLQVTYSKEDLVIVLRTSESTSGTGSVNYGGIWNGGPAAYQEMWLVPSGSYAGFYICINESGTTLNPWQGIDWHMLSQASAIGNW